jgi:hypothetical protein
MDALLAEHGASHHAAAGVADGQAVRNCRSI